MLRDKEVIRAYLGSAEIGVLQVE
ncbi:MAG: hypothetical protein ABW003_00780 [Microvirga sp.]